MKRICLLLILLAAIAQANAKEEPFGYLKGEPANTTNSVLIFFRPDCNYCIEMENAIRNNPALQQSIMQRYSVAAVNISTTEGQKIAKLYNVKAVPTIIKYNSQNHETATCKGFGSIARLSEFLSIKSIPSGQRQARETATCGNGVREGEEQCDDGNAVGNDGCEANCTLTKSSVCGNGTLEYGVQCDDANTVGGDGCGANCTLTNPPVCGNGTKEYGEQCDDGNAVGGDGCEKNCTITPVCGNGSLEYGEQCDDGNAVVGDGCEKNCTITATTCGNGTKEYGEQCDDGNAVDGDGCEKNCTITPATCGNGIKEYGEQCDDGNAVDGDGCEKNCTITATTCGNGIKEYGEQCDDGNAVNGDGCEKNCTATTTAIDDESEKQMATIAISPNPFSENLVLKFFLRHSSNMEVVLYEPSGKAAYHFEKSSLSFGNNEITLNPSNLQKGCYVLRLKITNHDGTFYQTKMVIKE